MLHGNTYDYRQLKQIIKIRAQKLWQFVRFSSASVACMKLDVARLKVNRRPPGWVHQERTPVYVNGYYKSSTESTVHGRRRRLWREIVDRGQCS